MSEVQVIITPEKKEKQPREITLPSGLKAVIQPGKGKHSIIATRMANSDTSMVIPAMMAQLVTIEGNPVLMEDFKEMELSDYMFLIGEFTDLNF